MWLLKVPEIVAKIAAGSSEGVLGTFSSSAALPAGSGLKRPRTQLRLELDAARVEQALGAEAAKSAPTRYNLLLEQPAFGARILTTDERGQFNFEGVVHIGGAVVRGRERACAQLSWQAF